MTELVQMYLQIALLRRGPQDLPASALLLAISVAGYVAVYLLADSALFGRLSAALLLVLLVDVSFTLAWYAALLRLLRRSERLLQTASAVFGYRAVLAPLEVAIRWLGHRFGEDSGWQLPLTIVSFILIAWMIAANAHILKAALEWTMLSCVGLVVLEFITSFLLLLPFTPMPR
jgi:hypothetical protein